MNLRKCNLEALANFLIGRRCVLVLGSGASLSSGMPGMPKIVRETVHGYGNKEQKAKLLKQGPLVPEELGLFFEVIDNFADPQLRNVLERLFPEERKPSKGYECLAELVARDCFPVILSTNVDPLLETILPDKGLKVAIDVDVIDCGDISNYEDAAIANLIVRKIQSEKPPIKLVKLHGSLAGSGKLRFRPKDIFDFPPSLQEVIEKLVNDEKREVVIIGHSMLDADLEKCFHRRGSGIWYVNPEEPKPRNPIYSAIDAREGSCYFSGEEGYFDWFFENLEEKIELAERGVPMSSKEEGEEDLEFINRLHELETVRRVTTVPGYPNFIAVDAPAGYGKTYFLRKLKGELEKADWLCPFVEGRKIPRENCKEDIVDKILQCVPEQERKKGKELIRSIARSFSGSKKIVLFFDDVNRLPEECLGWVRDKLIPGLNDSLKWPRNDFRVVVSGRHLVRGWVTESFSPKFVQELTPLSLEIVMDFVNKVSKEVTPEESSVVARNVLDITGGHPKGITEIVLKELGEKEDWVVGYERDKPTFYFTDEKCEELFDIYVSDILNEVKKEIGENATTFEIISILRRFNESILSGLISKNIIKDFSNSSSLRRWLLRTFLMSSPGPGEIMFKDKILRTLFVAGMKMKRENWSKYRLLNQAAAEVYEEALDKLCDILKPGFWMPELEPYLVMYSIESIYHHLEQKYSIKDVDLAGYLSNVVDKITKKLAELPIEESYKSELHSKIKKRLEKDPVYAKICYQISAKKAKEILNKFG